MKTYIENYGVDVVQMKLDKKDLFDLLNIPVKRNHIDQRLIKDFDFDFLHQKKNKTANTKTKIRKYKKMQRTRKKI